jgi:AbrB family looped-hinge helix DNA binding protein
MVSIATTQLSSKGQVVIPEEIRDRLGLRTGSRFVVVAGDGAVIFKVIDTPNLSKFRSLLKEARRRARKAGMKRSDVAGAIKRVRSRG